MTNVGGKNWWTQSTHEGIMERTLGYNTLAGKTWPCTIKTVGNQTVTVSFDGVSTWPVQNMTIPVAQSRYQRLPLQAGDQGLAMTADTFLGSITGGGGAPVLGRSYGNLSRLVFVPVGSSAFPAPADLSSHLIQGPTGVTLQTLDGTCKLVLTSTGVVITIGAQTFTLSVSGMNVAQGDVTVGSTNISSVNHLHTSESPGTPTSAPIAGT